MGVVSTTWRLILAAMIAMATPLSCCCAQGLLFPVHAQTQTQSATTGPVTENCCHPSAPQSDTPGKAIVVAHASHDSSLPTSNNPVPAKHCTKRIFIGAAEDLLPSLTSALTGDVGVLLHPLLTLDALLPALDAPVPSRAMLLTDPSPPQPRLRLITQLCVMTT